MIIASKIYDCQHGSDRKKSKKRNLGGARDRLVFSLRQGLAFFPVILTWTPTNVYVKIAQVLACWTYQIPSSRLIKCIMEKLESIQQSLDSNFGEAMSEINSLRADVNAQLSILKNKTDELKTSLDAAWK